MCQPIIQSVLFDQASYTTGQTMTATIQYTLCCSGPCTVAGADTGNRTWTVASNDGVSLATLTATA